MSETDYVPSSRCHRFAVRFHEAVRVRRVRPRLGVPGGGGQGRQLLGQGQVLLLRGGTAAGFRRGGEGVGDHHGRAGGQVQAAGGVPRARALRVRRDLAESPPLISMSSRSISDCWTPST